MVCVNGDWSSSEVFWLVSTASGLQGVPHSASFKDATGPQFTHANGNLARTALKHNST